MYFSKTVIIQTKHINGKVQITGDFTDKLGDN